MIVVSQGPIISYDFSAFSKGRENAKVERRTTPCSKRRRRIERMREKNEKGRERTSKRKEREERQNI